MFFRKSESRNLSSREKNILIACAAANVVRVRRYDNAANRQDPGKTFRQSVVQSFAHCDDMARKRYGNFAPGRI